MSATFFCHGTNLAAALHDPVTPEDVYEEKNYQWTNLDNSAFFKNTQL